MRTQSCRQQYDHGFAGILSVAARHAWQEPGASRRSRISILLQMTSGVCVTFFGSFLSGRRVSLCQTCPSRTSPITWPRRLKAKPSCVFIFEQIREAHA